MLGLFFYSKGFPYFTQYFIYFCFDICASGMKSFLFQSVLDEFNLLNYTVQWLSFNFFVCALILFGEPLKLAS